MIAANNNESVKTLSQRKDRPVFSGPCLELAVSTALVIRGLNESHKGSESAQGFGDRVAKDP